MFQLQQDQIINLDHVTTVSFDDTGYRISLQHMAVQPGLFIGSIVTGSLTTGINYP